jgi:Anti-sigma factor NepR
MAKETKNKVKAAKPGKKIEDMTPVSAKPAVSDLIALRLRKYYDAVAAQPVPDRFLDLLSQLEAASAQKKHD